MSISRVTTLQTSRIMMDYITSAGANYNKLAEQAASGIKVNTPSDDPVAAKKIMNITSQIDTMNNYVNNMKTAKGEINTTDAALASLTNRVEDASDYATQAANGTYSTDDLGSVKSQVDSIISSIVNLANTNYSGKYVFSGTATATQTYSVDSTTNPDGSITYNSISYEGTPGTDYERNVTISDGVSVAINEKGSNVFGYYNSEAQNYTSTDPEFASLAAGKVTTNSTDADGNPLKTIVTTVFNDDGSATVTTETASGTLGDLVLLSNALGNGDKQAISGTIDDLSKDLDTVTSTRTQLASVTNRFKITTDSIDDTVMNLTGYKKDLQEADLTETLTQLATAKNALEATYSITSQLLSSTTLLDYL